MERNPSHFGSKDRSPVGIAGTDLASIGDTGGMTGRCMGSLCWAGGRWRASAGSSGASFAVAGHGVPRVAPAAAAVRIAVAMV